MSRPYVARRRQVSASVAIRRSLSLAFALTWHRGAQLPCTVLPVAARMDSVARRRSARSARVALLSPASASAASSLGWRPWLSLLCHSAVRRLRRACTGRHASPPAADASRFRRVLSQSQLLAVFASVWLWHFVSPAAASLPGYKGFGRFARVRPATQRCASPCLSQVVLCACAHATAAPQFLTFCSFTCQVLVWTLAVVTDVVRPLRPKHRVPLPAPPRCPLSCIAPRTHASRNTPRQATLLRRAGGAGCRLSAAVDDAACAALPIATAVTMLYYALLTANPAFVEEPCVPSISQGMHVFPVRLG